jgi:hypothetical protein
MAIQTNNPELITFIHTPKTGGTSIKRWMLENINARTIKPKHGTHSYIKAKYKDLGWTFATIRNPYDWLVSWYEFKRQGAEARLARLIENPHLINEEKKRQKYSVSFQKEVLDGYNRGFDWWIRNVPRGGQIEFITGVDYVLKYENLVHDFKVIQERVNCFEPLPYNNKTISRKPYQEYYEKSSTIDYVTDKWKDDINFFGYTFD